MFLVYNSDILTEDEFRLPVDDRAFQYGDGLFETIRYENNHLWFWPDHMTRLTTGMAALRLQLPVHFTESSVQQLILQLLSTNDLLTQPARIKLQIWRKPGGLYTPTSHEINYLITARPGVPFHITEQTKIGIYSTIRLSESPVSASKTLNSLPYILAGLYKQENGFNDVILLSTEGHLAECIASNLFWFNDQTLFTPSLKTGCINGIARRQLLRRFTDCREGFFLPSDLDTADVVFAANVMSIQILSGKMTETQVGSLSSIFTDC
ncbi:aminotransferase class IV [Spirosoma aureum]|uniref:branched-chain-amino-acid transaminase n=1 Tax=Spirosoma aureum TaxID=2692134 RepID=A0A6G9AWC5_9BACT|nr:aminotransferase class IV [Spirosoma aureum]QIP16629.1 aminotransferase class IV [Spirosoma aureum]